MARRTTKKTTKRKSTRAKKSRVISVDFEGVETGGGSNVPGGEYAASIASAEEVESSTGNPMIKWVVEITNGRQKGKKLYHNTSLLPQSLWNLRGLLHACGLETPDSSYDLDLDEVEGAEVGIGVTIGQHEDNDQSRISDFFPIEEFNETDEESDEEDDDEEESEETEEETEEEGEYEEITPDDIRTYKLAELEELIEEYELDIDLKSKKTIAQRRKLVIDALTEEGVFEEE